MTRALHKAGLPIKFVPHCLTPSFEACTFRELIEFTTRQLKITRANAPHLWQAALTGSVLFVLVFFGGVALVWGRAVAGGSVAAPPFFFVVVIALGAMKAHLPL